MKYLELLFIYFSKIYIHFYQEKNDYWTIFPCLIIATLATINLELLSFYFINLNKYYYAGLAIFLIITMIYIFRNITYDYVVRYKISRIAKFIITGLILLNIILNIIFLNISRNGKFMF